MALTIAGFVKEYGPAADYAAAKTGLNSSEILGQWGLETGWGEHFAGLNNPGNVSPGGKVAHYPTLENGVNAYVNVINKLGLSGLNNDADFVRALSHSGYATDHNYAEKVYNTINAVEKVQNGEAGVSGQAILDQILPGNMSKDGQAIAESGGVLGWIDKKAANWGLIIVGVVLGVSALIVQVKQ